ncbi:dihydrofolate reductase family protein [Actinomadura sp. ATCC 31491]|uniref:Dihydrofolate reductase family protein n=1 Tax=Actinomadura luzonensis TaxID=2805427 RepID=A0ABT0FY72_9ACTN|nr:dihydrofolate reductase family protein [Actinomadura luzonensis]MCK2217280.1 dihydrofolate reductase family protein [Actinomadura luzonensis]
MARRPYVVAHVGVSLDGATTGFQPDVARFYELAATWGEDLTLTGADTVLAQYGAPPATPGAEPPAPGPGPDPEGPLLAVVDGRGRVRPWVWEALRASGYWSDVIALRCASTPPRPPGAAVREVVTGAERVDLAAALDRLDRDDGVRVVRVDSGGALLGALLAAGLLDEISLLVHPCVAGGRATRFWYGAAPPAPPVPLAFVAAEPLPGGLVWLRYRRSL